MMNERFTIGGHFRDPALEKTFIESAYARYQKFYKLLGATLGMTAGLAGLLNALVGYGRYTPSPNVDLLCLFNLLVLVAAFRDRRTSLWHSRLIIAAFKVFSAVIIILACLSMPTMKSAYMQGLVSFHLLFFGVVPHPFRSKLIVLVLTALAYVTALAIGHQPPRDYWTIITLAMVLPMLSGIFIGIGFARYERTVYLLQGQLNTEKRRVEDLLHQMMPQEIADRMRSATTDEAMVSRHQEVSVLFADLVGFTGWAASRPTEEVVEVLNKLFSRFDMQTTLHAVEKIKTIGDAYMAVSGLPRAVANSAVEIAELALEMREAVAKFSHLTGLPMQLRIGIHTGSVMAGVIGRNRLHYDLWGDTVNLASRLESHGVPGAIQASEETMRLLEDRYDFEYRGSIDLRGKGPTKVYVLKGPRLTENANLVA